jgi:hypothetical protein
MSIVPEANATNSSDFCLGCFNGRDACAAFDDLPQLLGVLFKDAERLRPCQRFRSLLARACFSGWLRTARWLVVAPAPRQIDPARPKPCCTQYANVCCGSWLCENAKTLNRDRRSYSSKTALGLQFASAFNLEIKLENVILVAFRLFAFLHSQGQTRTSTRATEMSALPPQNGHRSTRTPRLKSARTGHQVAPDNLSIVIGQWLRSRER